jgi:hypothetical protein
MRKPLISAAAAIVLTAAGAVGSHVRAQAPAGAGQTTALMAQALTPVLTAWIEQSRDAAIAQGVEPIPDAMRAALEGYVPDEVLDRVRWRNGGSGEASLQQQLFRFEYSPAVTLDHVVVFEDRDAALNDPKLWAHELMHVMQYGEWGVPGFASRYLTNYAAVEREAVEYRWQYMKLKGLVPVPAGSRDAERGADVPPVAAAERAAADGR